MYKYGPQLLEWQNNNHYILIQQNKFEKKYRDILKELEQENIFIINEKQLSDEQGKVVKDYFEQEVRPALVPIMIDTLPEFPYLKDRSIYLAVMLSDSMGKEKSRWINDQWMDCCK